MAVEIFPQLCLQVFSSSNNLVIGIIVLVKNSNPPLLRHIKEIELEVVHTVYLRPRILRKNTQFVNFPSVVHALLAFF